MSDDTGGSDDKLIPVALVVAPDSPRKQVKSTAVVKYSAVPTPATFAQLQCNTDLNLPPSNWLSSSAESYGLQSVWSQSTGFSSFRMAHMFPDCVGEVDVVSDAENIKRLLKMPYNQGVISMMVHRVENTLLLDDFDIQKYLLRQAESDWEWLKKFVSENIFQNASEKDKRLYYKSNSRNALQQKNLVSKFLYHSLVLADNNEKVETPPLPLSTLEPVLPEPTLEEKLPDPNHSHNFARNVVWTFENIQMLIGTDMPIFGGQTHPCISLRLCDMRKPINVLTGIDYWLDNLMCNVPEVVMCYHLDGIVQKYELIKTEDLPNLDDSKFSPKVIRDVAQNILSFLKNNATKAGHTYWLFKGKNDDVVKLYDLTSLCSETSDDSEQNPFTVPVAMLLYRVARNMKYSSDSRKQGGTIRMLLKNCVQLLAKENHPQIVTSAHYMLSDLYVPADTDPANPTLVDQSQDEDASSECGSSQENSDGPETAEDQVSAAVKSLMLAHIQEQPEHEEHKYKPPPISGNVADRCLAALEHVYAGLDCLQYFPSAKSSDDETKKSTDEGSSENTPQEEVQNVAKPFQAIPMPYTPLQNTADEKKINSPTGSPSHHKKKGKQKKNKKSEKNTSKESLLLNGSPRALLCKSKVDTLPTWQAPKKSDNLSWNAHLKTLLYEKASLIYAVLAEYEYSNQSYGASLRYILAVLRCQKILEVFCCVRNDKLISYLLGRAGDCCFMTVQDWRNIEDHKRDYEQRNENEEKIVEEILGVEDLDMNGAELLPEKFDSLEKTMVASLKCYEKALELDPPDVDKNNLLRRLGNIQNELGVFYMNQASARCQQAASGSNELTADDCISDVTCLLTHSLTHFESGIKAFETVHDEANLALLHSNTGRLMRLCAHIHAKSPSQERHFYNKALASYQKAVQVLGTRKTNPVIWETVTWDYSSALYNVATTLQDFPTVGSKSEDELEREVVEFLQKALKYCDTETPGPRQPVYQFRAATIQHRLASLYHRIYRELKVDVDNTKRKNALQLSKLYYMKAAKLFLFLEQPFEFLTVQLERVALIEHQAETASTFNKLNYYQNAVDLILQCQPVIAILREKNGVTNKIITDTGNSVDETRCDSRDDSYKKDLNTDDQKQGEDEEKLVLLLEQRLQYLLRSLIKLCLVKSPEGSRSPLKYDNLANTYKHCYSLTLKSERPAGSALFDCIHEVLQEIERKLKATIEVQ